MHERAEIWNFSSSVQRDIELNTRREIPYLQATMYYFVYYINTKARNITETSFT